MSTAAHPSLHSSDPNQTIGGIVQSYRWVWNGQSFTVVYETRGSGAPVLLLPALSTVSTRSEMRGLAEQLSTRFQVTAIDWLGFGQSDRPPLGYSAALSCQLLRDLVNDLFAEPVAVVAAGHSAGYVMQLASTGVPWSAIVLSAPTWRGPLPTMGASESIAGTVRQLVRSPLLGQGLYAANTTPSFLKLMYGRHVYVSRDRLTPEFIAQKRQVTQQPGARFASAAFVTGALDPVKTRAEFLALFASLSMPILAIVAEQSPPKSKAEMEVLASIPGVQVQRLPGTLGLHEEFASEVAAIVLPFLG